MVRKTREEKAITLIALIITIVVLLILAVVAINSVTGDGIIQHATNAKTEYSKAQTDEQGLLSEYQQYLATLGNVGPWKEGEVTEEVQKKDENGNTVTDESGNPVMETVTVPAIIKTDKDGNTQAIKIGATVTYDPSAVADAQKLTYTSLAAKTGMVENQVFKTASTSTETLTWKVLGEENGKIMLIASTGIAPVESEDSNLQSVGYALAGKDACNNAVQEINNACAIYGYGKGAESARSLNCSDIEKIAGITQTDKENAELATTFSYGHKYTYEYVDGTVKLSEDGKTAEDLGITEVYFLDGVVNSENPGPKAVTCNYFYVVNMENRIKTSALKDIILNGEITWIPEKLHAVLNVTVRDDYPRGYMEYAVRIIDSRNGSNTMNYYGRVTLYDSKNETKQSKDYAIKVRPVVTLKADTVLTQNGEVYNIG